MLEESPYLAGEVRPGDNGNPKVVPSISSRCMTVV